ncbi:MAG: hypothetical protein C0404_04810, partial [Verrucomicrobia bacterium]|nr:hypothetical protein [Verrucomicrobiota bacterium]
RLQPSKPETHSTGTQTENDKENILNRLFTKLQGIYTRRVMDVALFEHLDNSCEIRYAEQRHKNRTNDQYNIMHNQSTLDRRFGNTPSHAHQPTRPQCSLHLPEDMPAAGRSQ